MFITLPIARVKNQSWNKYRAEIIDNFFQYDIGKFEKYLINVKAEELDKLSNMRTLKIFYEAAQRIPAYKDFLKKNKVDPKKIKSIRDFKRGVPITSKENYIAKYPIKMLAWDGTLREYSIAAVSSGTSGKPTLWPRDLITEYESGYLHEHIISTLFQGNKKTTLGVVAFHMGMYTAGIFTLRSLQIVSEKGYPIISVSPGMNVKDVIESICNLYDQVNQVILFTYPSLVKSILDGIEDRKIKLADLRMHLVPAGEPFTENWKNNTLSRLSNSKHSSKLFSIYGCSEKTILGHETPAAIGVKKLLNSDEGALKKLGYDSTPNVYQYYPFLRYFESLDGALLFTATGGIPLMRYRIGDFGEIMSFEKAQATWKNYAPLSKNKLKLPFVFVRGREQALTFYGANIYKNNIEDGLASKKISHLVTGRFTMRKEVKQSGKEHLYIYVELANNQQLTPSVRLNISDIIKKTIQKKNAEHSVVVKTIGKESIPTIVIHQYRQKPYFGLDGKHRWIIY